MIISLEEAERRVAAFEKRLPLLVGNEIVNFMLDNFDKQGFQDSGLEKWQQRKDGSDSSRNILIGRGSGRGRRSLRITRKSDDYVQAGTDLEYMAMHNEGGQIPVSVTKKSRKFFWAMYYKTGNEMWKGMALTKKKQMIINIPERRFIGKSKELNKRIIKMLERQLDKIFN